MSATLQVRPLAGSMGAEILGIDLSSEIDEAVFARLRQAFLDHIAIFFPAQDLTPDDLTRFCARFGELGTHPTLTSLPGQAFVHELRKEPEQVRNFAGVWHTDGTVIERPTLANGLYAVDMPAFGGDTLFVNTCQAYDALSEGMQRLLGNLRLVHAVHEDYYAQLDGMKNRNGSGVLGDRMDHPLVRRHPDTGRKCLYLSPFFASHFLDMTPAESRPLLDFLHSHALRPEFQFRYRWRSGDFGIWDNRCSMHYAANDYQGQRRVMHRLYVREPVRPI